MKRLEQNPIVLENYLVELNPKKPLKGVEFPTEISEMVLGFLNAISGL